MSNLPRILIVDDQWGRTRHSSGGLHPRSSFCLNAGFKDVTGDIPCTELAKPPVAEAVFCQGQIEEDGIVLNDLEGTIDTIRNGWKEWPRWALVMLDLQFITGKVQSDGTVEGRDEDSDPTRYFGLSILERMQSDSELKNIPVVLLTSMERKAIEKRFADLSVCEFLYKGEIDRHNGRQRSDNLLQDHGLIEDQDGRVIGHSIALLKCLREARRRSKLGNSNILLFGETGTGKELVASYIYHRSGREPYVPCLLNGVPDTLVEDRIFGHRRGAFSGADRDQPGAAEQADNGVLFIDEFGDITPNTQPKLLRLLHTDIRETQRIGDPQVRRVDLLVVAATERIEIMSGEDTFRKSLLQRVNISNPLILPPLRERKEDIPDLVEHLVRFYENQFRHLGAVERQVPSEAKEHAMSYSWPGNVNELKSVIERAVFENLTIRYLSKNHIKLPTGKKPAKSTKVTPESEDTTFESEDTPRTRRNLSEVISNIESLQFETSPEKQGELLGAYAKLKEAYTLCSARMLKTAMIAKRKVTPEHPEGIIEPTPAVKLLMGKKKLASSPAAGEINGLYKYSPKPVKEYMDSDPILAPIRKWAYENRNPKKASK